MNYECHITTETSSAEKAAQVAQTLGWKTSEIARDPLLGDKNYFYLTLHERTFGEIKARMEHCVSILRANEIPVIRQKIEIIIFDTKTGVGV